MPELRAVLYFSFADGACSQPCLEYLNRVRTGGGLNSADIDPPRQPGHGPSSDKRVSWQQL
jgi:hypothetical protein